MGYQLVMRSLRVGYEGLYSLCTSYNLFLVDYELSLPILDCLLKNGEHKQKEWLLFFTFLFSIVTYFYTWYTLCNKKRLLRYYLFPSTYSNQGQTWPVKGPDASAYQYQCYISGILLTLLPISLLISRGTGAMEVLSRQ